MMGASWRQGSHQSAEKSTTSGMSLPWISLRNVASVNVTMRSFFPGRGQSYASCRNDGAPSVAVLTR